MSPSKCFKNKPETELRCISLWQTIAYFFHWRSRCALGGKVLPYIQLGSGESRIIKAKVISLADAQETSQSRPTTIFSRILQ